MCELPKTLSSVVTPVVKIGMPGVLLLGGGLSTWFCIQQGNFVANAYGHALMWAFLFWLTFMCFRFQVVVAYADRLLVGHLTAAHAVHYADIIQIKATRAQSAILIRLRIEAPDQHAHSVHLMLPSRFATIDCQPEFALLRGKCPQLCEVSRNWLLGVVKLDPAMPTKIGSAETVHACVDQNEGPIGGEVAGD